MRLRSRECDRGTKSFNEEKTESCGRQKCPGKNLFIHSIYFFLPKPNHGAYAKFYGKLFCIPFKIDCERAVVSLFVNIVLKTWKFLYQPTLLLKVPVKLSFSSLISLISTTGMLFIYESGILPIKST